MSFPLCQPRARRSGGDRPDAVPSETEVEEASQIDGRGAHGEGLPVSFGAAVADFAVAVGDEPGNGSFDHRSVLAVVVDAVASSPSSARDGEVLVVFGDMKGLASDGRRAA